MNESTDSSTAKSRSAFDIYYAPPEPPPPRPEWTEELTVGEALQAEFDEHRQTIAELIQDQNGGRADRRDPAARAKLIKAYRAANASLQELSRAYPDGWGSAERYELVADLREKLRLAAYYGSTTEKDETIYLTVPPPDGLPESAVIPALLEVMAEPLPAKTVPKEEPRIYESKSAFEIYEYGRDLEPGLLNGKAISPRGVSIVAALSGTGKTFFDFHLAYCYADEESSFGPHTIAHGTALIVSLEMNEQQVRRRLRSQFTREELRRVGKRLRYVCRPDVKLDFYGEPEKSAKLMRTLVEVNRAGLVVVENLCDVHSGDENSNKDMYGSMKSIRDDVAQRTGAALVYSHHTGNPNEFGKASRHRGASAIRDVAEDVLVLERRPKSSLRTVTFNKMRWDDFPPFAFDLAKDKDGLVRVSFPTVATTAEAAADLSGRDEQVEDAIALQDVIWKATGNPKLVTTGCPGVSQNQLAKLCGVDKRKPAFVQALWALVENQKVLEAVAGPRDGIYYRRPV